MFFSSSIYLPNGLVVGDHCSCSNSFWGGFIFIFVLPFFFPCSKSDMSRLRLAAGGAIMKLAQEPCYHEIITPEQFQLCGLVINVSRFFIWHFTNVLVGRISWWGHHFGDICRPGRTELPIFWLPCSYIGLIALVRCNVIRHHQATSLTNAVRLIHLDGANQNCHLWERRCFGSSSCIEFDVRA